MFARVPVHTKGCDPVLRALFFNDGLHRNNVLSCGLSSLFQTVQAWYWKCDAFAM